MKNRRLIILFIICIMIVPTNAFAMQPESGDCDIFVLKRLLSSNSSNNNEIINQVSDEDKALFVEEKIELAKEKINLLEMESSLEMGNKVEEIIDLGDECYVKITLQDEPEFLENASLPNIMNSTPQSNTLWKNYGNRKFTSTYEISVLFTKYKMSLCNHYTLSGGGISLRYGESMFYCDNKTIGGAQKAKPIKSKAGIGESIGISGEFNVSSSKIYKMTNKVKCVQIDDVNDCVKIIQSWNGDWR